MHLYEEYDLIEHLWEDLPENSRTSLDGTNDEPLDESAGAVFSVVFQGITTVLKYLFKFICKIFKWTFDIAVMGFTLIEQALCLLAGVVTQGLKTVFYFVRDALDSVNILTDSLHVLTEDISREQMETVLKTFTFEQAAAKNPKLQAYIQELQAAEGPEKTKKALAQTELWMQQNAKLLARVLCKISLEDFESNEEQLTNQITNLFRQEFKNLEKKNKNIKNSNTHSTIERDT